MLTVAIVSLKGGVGKSTIALNLASCLHASLRVVLVDSDPQGTASSWAARAVECGREGVPVVAMTAASLVRDLPSLAPSFDVAIIDTPPRLGAAARGAMLAADVVLVPCGPGPSDVWATAETIVALDEARTLRHELVAALVLNRADRTAIARSAEKALGGMGAPLLDVAVGQRVAFAEATIEGMGVTEHAPRSAAAMDVRRLTRAVLAMAGIAHEVAA
jgi:chromosome partitioning protein